MTTEKQNLERRIEYYINEVKHPRFTSTKAERRADKQRLKQLATQYKDLTGEYYDITRKDWESIL